MGRKPDCNACEDLRDHAPDFVFNGITDDICTSLQNDTGLNPKATTIHTDCEDLDSANDCLVGRMDNEVDSYDVCDWKDFMHAFIPNLWTVLKGIICAICGIWKKIHKQECEINTLFNGYSFKIGESATDDSYVVPGVGVSYTEQGSQVFESDISLLYISGGLLRGRGQLRFHNTDWEETIADINGNKGKGNPIWGTTGGMVTGNELIYEIRIKDSAFPFVKKFYPGIGHEVGGPNGFHVSTNVFEAGSYAYGQHGRCYTDTGEPAETGYSKGHLVPEGWTYIQVRMTYIFDLVNGSGYAVANPTYFMGIRMKQDALEC